MFRMLSLNPYIYSMYLLYLMPPHQLPKTHKQMNEYYSMETQSVTFFFQNCGIFHMLVQYDNTDLNGIFFHEIWIVCGLFVVIFYIITYPKFFCHLFTLTKTLVRFAVMSFSSGAADEAAPTNESKQTRFQSNFQVNVKRRITFFGKRISGKL